LCHVQKRITIAIIPGDEPVHTEMIQCFSSLQLLAVAKRLCSRVPSCVCSL